MSYLPEMFEIKKVFFGLRGVNILCLNGETLIFEWNPDIKTQDNRKLEISPLEGEWLTFWSQMDNIGIWNWKDKYHPPEDICADGDIFDIKILLKGRKVETNCWCNAPQGMGDFYKALNELIGLDIEVPGGIKR